LDWFGWSRRGDRGVVAGWVKVGGEGERSEAGPSRGSSGKGFGRSRSFALVLLSPPPRRRERPRDARRAGGGARARAIANGAIVPRMRGGVGGDAPSRRLGERGRADDAGVFFCWRDRRRGRDRDAPRGNARGGGDDPGKGRGACVRERERGVRERPRARAGRRRREVWRAPGGAPGARGARAPDENRARAGER